MRVGENWRLQEFVPKETYYEYGVGAIRFVDQRCINAANWLKFFFPKGAIIINDWLWGGERNNSGYRLPNCEEGVFQSPHKSGIAIDCIFTEYESEEVRQYLKDNHLKVRKNLGITRVENGTPHVHIDFVNCRWEGIRFFNP